MDETTAATFKNLDAWRVGVSLTVLVYEIAKRLPVTERFELSSQIRRAAVSIPANVAEGQSCGRYPRYIFHVRIAKGSLGELETHLEVARRLGFVSDEDLRQTQQELTRAGQLLNGLLRSLKRRHLAQLGRRLSLLAAFLLTCRLLAALG
jgi:four helix bundle protein